MNPEQRMQEIVDLYKALLEAWNRRDADAFAATFAPDGSVVGFDGSDMNGRDDIARELAGIFAHHPTAAYVGKVRALRQLDSNVTLLRAVVGMVPPGASALNPTVNAVQSVVATFLSDGPKIALLQNTPAAYHGRPELAGSLTEELTSVMRSGRVLSVGQH